MPDVICEYCLTCIDLDICRDIQLNQQDENGEVSPNWECRFCTKELNKQMIERRLIDLVNRRLIAYQMQDLKCK